MGIMATAREFGWSYWKMRRYLHSVSLVREMSESVHIARRPLLFVPTDGLREIVDGLLLGDASIEATSYGGRLSFGQSGHRMDWVKSVADEMKNLGVALTLSPTPPHQTFIKGKACERKARITLRTRNYPWFHEQRSRWYPDQKKIVPRDISLTPKAIALWYCGDGKLQGGGYSAELCTDDFPPWDVEFLVECLSEYGLDLHSNKKNRIVLTGQKNRTLFSSLVTPHMPACFAYKMLFKTRSTRYVVTDTLREDMQRLRTEGMSYGKIASQLGLTKSTVYTAMTATGDDVRRGIGIS